MIPIKVIIVRIIRFKMMMMMMKIDVYGHCCAHGKLSEPSIVIRTRVVVTCDPKRYR